MGKSRAGKKKKPAAGGPSKNKAHADPVAPLNRAGEVSQEGNQLYKEGQSLEAFDKYGQALALTPEGHQDRAVLHSDRAACMLLMQPVPYSEVIKECTAALDLNPKYASALLQRAKAHEQLASYHAALQDVEVLLKNEAHNDEAKESCRRLHSHIKSGKAANAGLPAREAKNPTASPLAAKAQLDASGPSPTAGSSDSCAPAANSKATRGTSRKDISQTSASAVPQPVPPTANHVQGQGLESGAKPKAGSMREASKIAAASLAKQASPAAAAAAVPTAAVIGGNGASAATGNATGGTSLEGSLPSTSTSPKRTALARPPTAKDVQGQLLETKSKPKAGPVRAKQAGAAAAVSTSTVSSDKGAPVANDSATGGTSLEGSLLPSTSTSPTRTAMPLPPTAIGVQGQSLETKSNPKAEPVRAKQAAGAAAAAARVVSATTVTSATGASTSNDSATGGTSLEGHPFPSTSTSSKPMPLSPPSTKTKSKPKAKHVRAKQAAAAAAAAEVSTSTVSSGNGAPAANGSAAGGMSLEGSLLPSTSTSPSRTALLQPPTAKGVQGHGLETESKPKVEPLSGSGAPAATGSTTGGTSLEEYLPPSTSTSPQPMPLPPPPTANGAQGQGLETKRKPKAEAVRPWEVAAADGVRFPLVDGEQKDITASGEGEAGRGAPAGPKESAGAPQPTPSSTESGNASSSAIYNMGTASVDTPPGKGVLALPVGLASLALGPGVIGIGAYIPMQICHLAVICHNVAALDGSEWEASSLLDLSLKKLALDESNARADPHRNVMEGDSVSVVEMEDALNKSCDEEFRANMDQSIREMACNRSDVTAILDQNVKEMKRLLTDLVFSIGRQEEEEEEAALLSRTEIESLQVLTMQLLDLHGPIFQNLIAGSHCQVAEAENVKALAIQLSSKLAATLQKIPQGHPRRFPLVLLQVFAARATADAHNMVADPGCSLSNMKMDAFNTTVLRDTMATLACEARSLVSHSTCTPYSMAVDSAPALAHYVLLYKSLTLALEGRIWKKPVMLGQNGSLLTVTGKESILWEDGMDELRVAAADGMDELRATNAFPHMQLPDFQRGVESKLLTLLSDFELEVKLRPVDPRYFAGVSLFSRCWQGIFACLR